MILVTGATGFLGAELAKQLVEGGEHIRCIKRPASIIPQILISFGDFIQWVDADMFDVFALEDAFDNITHVYHCAAWVSLKQADKEPMIQTNVTITANLVNQCLQKEIRLVHVSSIAAIGIAKPGELITENHHLDQAIETDGYAISKLESEMEVWRGIAEGLDAVIVNPSIIIGANAGTEGSGQLFEMVNKGLNFYTVGSSGFVSVQDVAKSMIMLMKSDITAERYIISAQNINYKEFVEEIAGCLGVKSPDKVAKPWMMELAWRGAALVAALTGKSPMLDKVSARASNAERLYDNAKIRKAVPIEFKPLSETIKEVCSVNRSNAVTFKPIS